MDLFEQTTTTHKVNNIKSCQQC